MKFNFNGKEISIDSYLAEKLDIMCERVTKHKFDNLLLIDGDEGYGKSNLAAVVASYVAYKTGRSMGNKNVSFLADDLINHAVATKEQILWWDEAALGGLASESYSKIQIKLLKLLMVARKKQHFYIFVIPKVFKLKEGLVDRAVGLLHVYSRDSVTRGRFAYFRRENKDKLVEYWRQKKQKGYKMFFDKLGSFSEALPLVIDEKLYDEVKDKAILSVGDIQGNPAMDKALLEIERLKGLIASMPGITQEKMAEHVGVS